MGQPPEPRPVLPSPAVPDGARLVLPIALLASCVAIVLKLADAAREHDGISASLDPRVAGDLLHARTPTLTVAARILTTAGSEPVVGALALFLVIFLLERRGAYIAACAASAVAVAAGLTVGVKLLVQRARPGVVDRLGPIDRSYSFPSGHTLNSAVLLGLVVLLAVPMIPRRAWRVAVTASAVLLAVGIGASRLYLGYHWTSDVLASWLIAVAVLVALRIAVRRQSGRRA